MMPSLRKFGLSYCDLPTMFENVSYFLRLITLNIDDSDVSIFLYIIFVLMIGAYFYVFIISTLWFIFWRCKETGDFLAALICLSLVFASEIGTVKFICMYIYIGKIRQIVSQCLACDALVEPNSRFAVNLAQTLRLVKKRAMIFWSVIMVNAVLYIIKPLLMPGGHHNLDDFFTLYGLEPKYGSRNDEIAFCLFTVAVMFGCYIPANITAFFIVVAGYIEAQMLAWSNELNHLWKDANNNYDERLQSNSRFNTEDSEDRKKSVDKFIRKRLFEIIKGHSTAIILFHNIENVFRVAIAGEFCLLIMALVAELLGGLENTYLQIPFALIQVGMDCLVGQRLIDASTFFERSVFECKWENFDKASMKIVLVILQNSQKTMALSAGGITRLSFMSFMSIIRTIYSLYTTLRTTMK